MTAQTPKELLARHGLNPKKSWGQNFLGDERVLSQIVDAVAPRPHEPVVELGPGLGHLTRALVEAGARVTAVERDRDMVRVLEERALPNVRVVAGNAAQTDFARVAGVDQVAVVGNLPYHLTSVILFEVLDQRAHVPRAVFTVQREVAERLAAAPGGRDYGILSVLLGLFFDVSLVFTIGRHLFHPPPNVDSAVVRLSRLGAPRAEVRDEARFRHLVKAGFGQRRKTLLNALKGAKSLGDAASLSRALEHAGVDGRRRAETLTPEEFAAIERAL